MNDDEMDRRLRAWGEAARRTAPAVRLPDFPRRGRWRAPLIVAAGVIVVAVAASAGITHGFGVGAGISATSPSSGGGISATSSSSRGRTHATSPSSGEPGACVPSGDGSFSLSLAIDSGGQATPQRAAAYFGEHGDTPGFGAPADAWMRIPDPNHGVEPGVALRAGDVFVHVIELSDDTWVVDSGGHCQPTSTATGRSRGGTPAAPPPTG